MKRKLLLTLLSVICVFCCIVGLTACGNGVNGTYYRLRGDELVKDEYYILESGKWTDADGFSGTYKQDGDKIILYMDVFDSREEYDSCTFKDNVLIFDSGRYVSEKHEHTFGAWKITQEATVTGDGERSRSCACGV